MTIPVKKRLKQVALFVVMHVLLPYFKWTYNLYGINVIV